MCSCDACGKNVAVTGTIMTSSGEGSFCRSCKAGCNKHWCHPSECGCLIEIECIDCGIVLATIKAGEPEPPLRCAGCQAEEDAA
jgi:hypothetical protein